MLFTCVAWSAHAGLFKLGKKANHGPMLQTWWQAQKSDKDCPVPLDATGFKIPEVCVCVCGCVCVRVCSHVTCTVSPFAEPCSRLSYCLMLMYGCMHVCLVSAVLYVA